MGPEEKYKQKLVAKIRELFPSCYILNTDPRDLQGIPDLLILHKDRWAALEIKASEKAKRRPNQEFYVDDLNKLSYASFIFPENEERVLNELQSAFGT